MSAWQENGIDSGLYENHETNESFWITQDWDVYTVNFPNGSQDFDSRQEAKDAVDAWIFQLFIQEYTSR
jgi:hypothetical protein